MTAAHRPYTLLPPEPSSSSASAPFSPLSPSEPTSFAEALERVGQGPLVIDGTEPYFGGPLPPDYATLVALEKIIYTSPPTSSTAPTWPRLLPPSLRAQLLADSPSVSARADLHRLVTLFPWSQWQAWTRDQRCDNLAVLEFFRRGDYGEWRRASERRDARQSECLDLIRFWYRHCSPSADTSSPAPSPASSANAFTPPTSPTTTESTPARSSASTSPDLGAHSLRSTEEGEVGVLRLRRRYSDDLG